MHFLPPIDLIPYTPQDDSPHLLNQEPALPSSESRLSNLKMKSPPPQSEPDSLQMIKKKRDENDETEPKKGIDALPRISEKILENSHKQPYDHHQKNVSPHRLDHDLEPAQNESRITSHQTFPKLVERCALSVVDVKQNREELILNQLKSTIDRIDKLYCLLLRLEPLAKPRSEKKAIEKLEILWNSINENAQSMRYEEAMKHIQKHAWKLENLKTTYQKKIYSDLFNDIRSIPSCYPGLFDIENCESNWITITDVRHNFASIINRLSLLTQPFKAQIQDLYYPKYVQFLDYEKRYENWLKTIKKEEIIPFFDAQKQALPSILAYSGKVTSENCDEISDRISSAFTIFNNLMQACSLSIEKQEISEQCHQFCGELSEMWIECFHKHNERKFHQKTISISPRQLS